MRWLFVDDEQGRHDKFFSYVESLIGKDKVVDCIYVYNAADAINALKTRPRFDCVYLDHDLADEHYYMPSALLNTIEGTGQTITRFIRNELDKSKYPQYVIVHSHNSIGGPLMVEDLQAVGIKSKWIPFK